MSPERKVLGVRKKRWRTTDGTHTKQLSPRVSLLITFDTTVDSLYCYLCPACSPSLPKGLYFIDRSFKIERVKSSEIFAEALCSETGNILLDGELLLKDEKAKSLEVREALTHFDRKGKQIFPEFLIFDTIFFNGENVGIKPLGERLSFIAKVRRTTMGIEAKGERSLPVSFDHPQRNLQHVIDLHPRIMFYLPFNRYECWESACCRRKK